MSGQTRYLDGHRSPALRRLSPSKPEKLLFFYFFGKLGILRQSTGLTPQRLWAKPIVRADRVDMDVKRSDPQTPEAREASAAGPSCPGAPAPAAGKPEEPASSEQDKGSGSAGPSAEKMAQMKEHKENVDANSEEEASIRLALELMRQESWEMHRIMQNETLLAMQEQKREALNRGTQNSHSIDEDLKLGTCFASQQGSALAMRLQFPAF